MRQSELLKPTALFTIQMEQSNLSDKTSALFMIAYLVGEVIGPILGSGLENWKGFDFTAISMVYVCIMVFTACLHVLFTLRQLDRFANVNLVFFDDELVEFACASLSPQLLVVDRDVRLEKVRILFKFR